MGKYLLTSLLMLSSCAPPAFARNWDEAATSADVAAWFRTLRQPDIEVSCCGETDAYHTDSFEQSPDGRWVAIITDERVIPGRPPIPVGTKIIIPPNKIVPNQGNPTGHGVVFVQKREDDDDLWNNSWHVFCYVTPGLF